MFNFYAYILMFYVGCEMCGLVGVGWFKLYYYIYIYIYIYIYVCVYVYILHFVYRYFSNALNILRFIFYIGTPHCDVSCAMRRYAKIFDAMLKCFSHRYVNVFFWVVYILHGCIFFIHREGRCRLGVVGEG